MADFSTQFAGLKLKNPIIAASSGLTDSKEKIIALKDAGVGAIVLKSIFEEEILMEIEQVQHTMVGRPVLFPETQDFLDEEPHEDLVSNYLELIKECQQAVEIPIIASINCISMQKWTYLAKEIMEAGADALELNLFPLSTSAKDAQAIEQEYLEIVETVKKQINIPLILKISPYFTNLAQMLERFSAIGVDAVVMFNRYYSPDIDTENMRMSPSRVTSSSSELFLPLRWIALLSNKAKLSIAATTGVHSGNDLIKCLLVGASAVQIASTLYLNGQARVQDMLKDLENWMQEHEWSSVEEFLGLMALNENNNTDWERLQFMREFRHFIR